MKKTLIGLGLFCLTLFSIGVYFYSSMNRVQIEEKTSIYIKSTDSLSQVISYLDSICNNINQVKNVIKLKKYTKVKPGKYTLQQGMSAIGIVNLLRSGKQTPVKVTFNNQNYIENLAGRLATQIEADSISILNSLTDVVFLKKHDLNYNTALNYCMPYTYDCYWNISPNQLRNKLFNAYKHYWNDNRIQKAKRLNLTKNEVVSLASIVHSESQHRPERKRIAGVYLNRVRVGMPLQADPTVNYAWKEKYGRNIIIKRTLSKYRQLESTYNTYLNRGIPPYSIAMPDVDAIDAVLNAERHNYYYFCASTEKFGTHKFARNLTQHNRNANAYHKWLNNQHIYR